MCPVRSVTYVSGRSFGVTCVAPFRPDLPLGQTGCNSRTGNAITATKREDGYPRVRFSGSRVVPIYPPAVKRLGAPRSGCQSARKVDPASASNFDPFERCARAVALAPSELVGVAKTARARVV